MTDSSFDRARRLFRLRPDSAADVNEEIRFHIDAAIQEGIAAGRSPEQARIEALERFGDVGELAGRLHRLQHEGNRIMHRKERWATVVQDVRFGIRQLRHNPGFTAIILLTLALGIGANTAIFSIVDAVLLKPLPFAEPDRIVNLRQDSGSPSGAYVPFPNFLKWASDTREFAALGGTVWQSFTLTGAGDPLRLHGHRASAGYWQVLRIPPALGRYYTANDDRYGGPRVVVLSHALWESAFGGDTSIIGRAVALDGVPYTVVAVAAEGFSVMPQAPQFWVPLASPPDEATRYFDHELTVVGRLRSGVSLASGVRELSRIEAAIQTTNPDRGVTGAVTAQPMINAIVGNARGEYLVLLGAVGLVLIIACSNVVNLLVARALTRRAEFTVRRALGAGAARIVSQLLVESALLAAGGAVLGIALAAAGIRFLVANTPRGVPRIQSATLNSTVLLFTAAVTIIAAVMFGLLPARRAARTDLQATLREGGRESRRLGRDRLRAGLIVAEIAVAMVLLTGAGLLVRSSILVRRVAPGFDPTNLLVAGIGLPESRYPSDDLVAARFAGIVAQVRTIPGVESAAMISRIPVGSGGADCAVRADGAPEGPGSMHDAEFRPVTPGYFATVRTPLVRGRDFTAADASGAPLVVIINATLARTLFGTGDPIGRRLVHCVGAPLVRTVVGVIPDVHANGLDLEPPDEIFYPESQLTQHAMSLVMRGTVPVAGLVAPLRRMIARIDPALPLANITTMRDVMQRAGADLYFSTVLLAGLGSIGLLLAAVGIYGVIAYFVTERTHEMGVRMALGAGTWRVRALVVRQGMALVLAGVLVGGVGAVLATRVLAGLVYGVSVRDTGTFVAVAVLLAATALAASFVPAWRATRIDPLTALRT